MKATNALLTPNEAAKLKGVSRTAVYAAIRDGRLKGVKILGRLGVREADLAKWKPTTYGGQVRAKGHGGRHPGEPLNQEWRERISEAQKRRWAQGKGAAEERLP